jgi:hypothetical protein
VRWALVALAIVAGTAHAQRMEEGEWEFVSEIAMPGLPRPQQSGYRACLTSINKIFLFETVFLKRKN